MYEPPPLGYANTVCRYDVTTIASRITTTIAIGTSLDERDRQPAAGMRTSRISSVAYAVDEMASDAKTGSATVLGSR